jgi:hypothetical protein
VDIYAMHGQGASLLISSLEINRCIFLNDNKDLLFHFPEWTIKACYSLKKHKDLLLLSGLASDLVAAENEIRALVIFSDYRLEHYSRIGRNFVIDNR